MNKTAKRLYTLCMVIFTPLGIYSTSFVSLSISDLFLFFSILVCTLFAMVSKKLTIYKGLLLFLIYIISNAFFMDVGTAEWLRTLRLFVYLFTISCFSKDFFDYEYAIKIYRFIALFATVFLFVQFILFKLFHYYLPGYLTFLNVNRTELVEYSSNIFNKSYDAQRMRSIFQEPAHYASYVSGCILILFLDNEEKYFKTNIILTVGIVISSAATGYLLGAFCWAYYILKRIKKGVPIDRFLPSVIFIVIGFVIISQSQSFEIVKSRNTGDIIDFKRFQGYLSVWELLSDSTIHLLFGNGMYLYESYLAGWIRMIYYFGVIGALIYVFPIIISIKKCKNALIIVVFIFVANVGTSILLSYSSMLLLSFMIINLYRFQEK